MKEYNERISRKPCDRQSGSSRLLKDRFRIYFPTNQTVRNSRGGEAVRGQHRLPWGHILRYGLIRTCDVTHRLLVPFACKQSGGAR